jgi:hypothetical protein
MGQQDRFTSADVARIVRETNLRNVRLNQRQLGALRDRLNVAAQNYFVMKQSESESPLTLPENQYRRIKNTADKLFKLLALPEGTLLPTPADTLPAGEWYEARNAQVYELTLIEQGFRLPPGCKESVKRLGDWASQAGANVRNRARRKNKRGRNPDRALNWFLGAVGGMWMDISQRLPSARTTRGESLNPTYRNRPTGPFYRFVCACCGHIGIPKTGLLDRLQRLFQGRGKTRRKKSNSPPAI